MATLHHHAPAIDRLGIPVLRSTFDMSRQAIHYWRRRGVPNEHRPRLFKLAAELRIKVPELNKPRA